MTMIVFAGRHLDHFGTETPTVVRGYDKAGNLLVQVKCGGRAKPRSVHAEQWFDAVNERYYTRNILKYNAFSRDGTALIAETLPNSYLFYDYDGYHSHLAESPGPFEFEPFCAVPTADGRIICASNYVADPPLWDGSNYSGALDDQQFFLDFSRVYRRGGDRIAFPALHGAQIKAIAVDHSDGSIYVGGLPAAADGCHFRKYDSDGALLWSIESDSVSEEDIGTIAIREIVTEILIGSDGGIYFGGERWRNDVIDEGFIVKCSSTGTVLWRKEPWQEVTGIAEVGSAVVTADGGYDSGAEQYTNLTKRDPATGAALAAAIGSDRLRIAVADGNVHAYRYPNPGGAWDYRVYSASDLSVIAESAIAHGITPTDKNARQNIAADADGVIYSGVRADGAISEWKWHFRARSIAGAWLWDDLAASGRHGLLSDGSPMTTSAYLGQEYQTPYGVTAGPDKADVSIGLGYPDYWSPAAVAMVAGTGTPSAAVSLIGGAFSWIGDTYTSAGSIAIALQAAVPLLRREYVGGLRLPVVYQCMLTGDPDITLQISRVQCRRNSDGITLSLTIPSASPAIMAEIFARLDGDMVLMRGVRFPGGAVQMEEMTRVSAWTARQDVGSARSSVILSGSGHDGINPVSARTLKGISYRSQIRGKRRVRCDLDTYLAPGDTAVIAPGESMIVSEISYSIGVASGTMEVAE